MFNHKHYVPILRWKAAEKGALEKLWEKHRGIITPLIEFIMPQPEMPKKGEKNKTPEELLNESIKVFLEKLPNISNQVASCWGQTAIFVDVQLIDGSIRADALEKILHLGKGLNIFMIPVINIIPVIGFESDAKTRRVAVNFAKESKHGLCIRISDSDFRQSTLAANIKSFIETNDLITAETDLLIDFKIVNEETNGKELIEKINSLPYLDDWRTFIVATGAFPKDLSHLEKHKDHGISRTDFRLWQDFVKTLKRAPSFSDYTIQHPIYTEPTPNANPSASIRYTLDDKWLIMRGEGLRNPKGAGFKQYPAQAQLLASQEIFKGADFSYGDAYIAEKAKDIKTKQTGNPKTWLEAGINHHLTLVAHQISNLP